MALMEWVRLPTRWIEDGGLPHFRWKTAGAGANNVAALMTLMALAHATDQSNGISRMIYTGLNAVTGLSRAKISAGLDILLEKEIVSRPEHRSEYHLTDFEVSPGWSQLPAKGLYAHGCISTFQDFTLRQPVELVALKLYFLFVSRRSTDTNMAHISYDKIEEYTRIDRTMIKRGLSFLSAANLVYVEHLPSMTNDHGLANAYRLAHLNPRIHMGTRGRGMNFDDC